jgi:hypothetical protein
LQQPAHAIPPHEQAPFTHASPVPHAPQALPPEPHSVFDCIALATQVVPLQQPIGQDAAVHSHAPVLPQAWPLAQVPQAAPPVPHFALLSPAYATQALPAQQPSGHDVASHTHWPFVPHSWPVAHAAQAPPAIPHAAAVDVTQVPFAEQQPAHVLVPQLQAPFAQRFPGEHTVHAAPPDPHPALDSDVVHAPFESQQPVGQVCALQTVGTTTASCAPLASPSPVGVVPSPPAVPRASAPGLTVASLETSSPPSALASAVPLSVEYAGSVVTSTIVDEHVARPMTTAHDAPAGQLEVIPPSSRRATWSRQPWLKNRSSSATRSLGTCTWVSLKTMGTPEPSSPVTSMSAS